MPFDYTKRTFLYHIDNESDNTSTVESTTPQIVAEQRLNGGSRNWFFNLFT